MSDGESDTERTLERLIDKYHGLKQDAQDETNDRYDFGKAEAYALVITDLEDWQHERR